MADAKPWLTIVGLGEDGPEGLSAASLAVLQEAEVIMGAKRHLGLLPDVTAELVEWPVPFADGFAILHGFKGRQTVALASGDPFWHGAGSAITRALEPSEWRALPGSGMLSLAAARLGWPLEATPSFGLHAAPFARLRPHLASGQKILATLRDGEAVNQLAQWLTDQGFGATQIHVLQALGGPRERVFTIRADEGTNEAVHPVSVGLEIAGGGASIPLASGRPDALFDNDGQITKRPVRALTLSALAPKHGEHLWDIGGGSGSIAIEWLMSHPSLEATCIEPNPERAERIRENAYNLGVSLVVIEGEAPRMLRVCVKPHVIFIGGGISEQMLTWIWSRCDTGTRLVANGVTLEAEALIAKWHADKGGDLMRIELAQSNPLGTKRGWKSSYPIVQWSVTL
ncbi:MAG: precorrin-6y C5,15-methyltransferase (decarboxylating) subunit CbiE [Cognatishimia sp.]|nr:precorrin-6y C5,15-methyltransferase (decarboxylating) subunit CbiE [Cognatishimia sp.]